MKTARLIGAALLLWAAGCGGDGGGGKTVRVQVSGRLTYEDKLFARGGFTGATRSLPIRFAIVQLVDDSDEVLAEATSNEAGAYSLSGEAEEGSRVRVVATSATDGRYRARVLDDRSRVYGLAGSEVSAAAGSRTEDLHAAASRIGGAFNILDQAIRGFDLVLARQSNATIPRLDLQWPGSSGPCPRTSCFSGSSNTMFLLDVPSDTDQYDDDVILHEFGHYVSNNFSWDTSPGGSHNPFDNNPEPPALAWSEGFAHWISAFSRGEASYVDTNSGGSFFFELEGPSSAAVTRGVGNEIAVGAILWDISDPANERHDALAGQVAALWDVVGPHFEATRPEPTTLDSFCSGWFARGHGQSAALAAIFGHRGVRCP